MKEFHKDNNIFCAKTTNFNLVKINFVSVNGTEVHLIRRESKHDELTHYLFGFFPLPQRQHQVHLSNIPKQISE